MFKCLCELCGGVTVRVVPLKYVIITADTFVFELSAHRRGGRSRHEPLKIRAASHPTDPDTEQIRHLDRTNWWEHGVSLLTLTERSQV